MVERDSWKIHHNLADAVDIMLAGGSVYGEIRTRLETGEIVIKEGRRPSPTKIPIVYSQPLTPIPFVLCFKFEAFVELFE